MNQEINTIKYNGYIITKKLNRKKTGFNFYFSDKEGKEILSQTLEKAKERIDYLVETQNIETFKAMAIKLGETLGANDVVCLAKSALGYETGDVRELSSYYFGNKPQHRGCDDDDLYSGEYRVQKVMLDIGDIYWQMWENGEGIGDYYDTEEEAKAALEEMWLENKKELEDEHSADNDDDDCDEEDCDNYYFACHADKLMDDEFGDKRDSDEVFYCFADMIAHQLINK